MLLSLAGAPLESVFCLCIALMVSVCRHALLRRRRCRRLHPDLYSLSLRQLYLDPRSGSITHKKPGPGPCQMDEIAQLPT